MVVSLENRAKRTQKTIFVYNTNTYHVFYIKHVHSTSMGLHTKSRDPKFVFDMSVL